MNKEIDLNSFTLVAIRRFASCAESNAGREEMFLSPNGNYFIRHTFNSESDVAYIRPMRLVEAEGWFAAVKAQIVWRAGDSCADILPFPVKPSHRRDLA